MPEQNITPSDPNNPTAPNTPQWGGDPNDPQWGGQTGTNAGAGGTLDPSTGTPAPNEGPGYQGTRNPQPGGGMGGNLNAGASDPNAGSGSGTDMDAGLGGSGSGYGGPVTPGGEADMPTTDPGQAGNASWAGQGQSSQGQQQGQEDQSQQWGNQSQGQGMVNSGQTDTGYVNRPGSNSGQPGNQAGAQPDGQNDVGTASEDSFPASDSPSFNPGRP